MFWTFHLKIYAESLTVAQHVNLLIYFCKAENHSAVWTEHTLNFYFPVNEY